MEPSHPGAIIQEFYLEELGITMTDIAKAIGVSPSTIGRIVNEKAAVTPDMAIKLSQVLSGSPESWLQLQMNYDLWHAEARNENLQLKSLVPA
ncbi:HigA family addiction module antitoxin [Lyngbya confervoides]|uniref:HigA family addiction module antitoxin n=1 Tax=Lyngbya confervoides BDU141951 TaxID=1574623 RepID=A0ABD4T2M6_9CYAN|nr:HigA family addiction module antitoxin [Lyngbya confervoides]MCM1982876.1 HigA family addiction module antitoxin [Lyngbya confervoides BDU141951]